MPKHIVPFLTICLMAASVAQAQTGGGGHGRGNRGGGAPSDSTPSSSSGAPPAQRPIPVDEIEIVGVVKAIAPDTERITIAYEAVDALNWPPGTMPFAVMKPALLKDVTVGEKVRFRLDSQQISDLRPF
jgi:Cu/Ag efflux protein CusF